ncbi:MAG: hypothetical protein FWG98_00805 [Candidatus Cloacimonetes bacterium]|nr:hypothetical protein [Candidatus Cloacimonadota bacterium]
MRNKLQILDRKSLKSKVMKKYLAFSFIILFFLPVFGIFNDYEPSSRARGMSGAVTSFSDDYSAIFYNPAGLRYGGNQVGATYYQLFGLDFTTLSAISGSYETKFGTFGLGYQALNVEYYDINLMSEQTFSLGHSFYLNRDVITETSLGYSLNVYYLSFHEQGHETSIGINAGMMAVLHQRTRIGIMLTNINKPKMGEGEKHEIPQKLAVGISYTPYQGVITAVDLKKNLDGETELRTGVEVELHPMMSLRMGVRNNPASYSFGAGFKVIGIHLDYSLNTHAVLDLTHHIGLGYKF